MAILIGLLVGNMGGPIQAKINSIQPSDQQFKIYIPLVSNGSSMVLVPSGTFQMGCDPLHNGGNVCYPEVLPLHTVYLDAYQIDKTEVTNAAYAGCVAAGICAAPWSNSSKTRSSYYGNLAYANYPVLYVNWNQAQAYCAWDGKRLPSEAEWEKAARGPTIQAYPWGDASPTCTLANFWGDYGAWSVCEGDTSQVGSHPTGASYYGAQDMAGNAWEWVNDWYDASYYSGSPLSNPTGPITGTDKVLRGGSWDDYPTYLRVSTRFRGSPANISNYIGFRCAANP